jgi:hypothetical protein
VDAVPAFGMRPRLQLSAQHRGPLPHPCDTAAAGLPGGPHASAVVEHGDLDGVGEVAHGDVRTRGARVAERVRQRLLDDAVGRQVDAGRQCTGPAFAADLDPQARRSERSRQRVQAAEPRLGWATSAVASVRTAARSLPSSRCASRPAASIERSAARA